jgi:hypothetical protein
MFQLLRNAIAALFRRPSQPCLGRLAEARKTEFFGWFNLVERVAPVAEQNGRMRHSFHPDGPAFQSLVRVDFVVTRDDAIVATQLALDRDFVEDEHNGAFARDIAKSFLGLALRNEQGEVERTLIANIASLASAPVIVRGPVPPPPPPDQSGGYAVYLGQRVVVELALEGTRLTLRNTANGRRWLVIDVTVA